MRALPYDSVARCPCAPGPEAGQREGRDATGAAPLRPGARSASAPVGRPYIRFFEGFRRAGGCKRFNGLTDCLI